MQGNARATSESDLASYRHGEILGRLATMESRVLQGQNLPVQGMETRTCYYCKTKGHIKRKCEKFAEDLKRGIVSSKNDWSHKPTSMGMSQGGAEVKTNSLN